MTSLADELRFKGSCEIVFTTSGEAADDKDPIIVDPTVIRNMAGWVIDQCVKDEGMGGAITKDLKHATDWILDPETAFYEHKMCKPHLPIYRLILTPAEPFL